MIKNYKISLRLQRENKVNLKEIVVKSANSRTGDDLKHLMLHLKFKVSYFSDFTRILILSICEKLEHEFFPTGSHLMNQGEIWDRMFILF